MSVMENSIINLAEIYDPRRNAKQLEFHRRPETYKLFGGAMGGGKTAALVNEALALSLDYSGNFGLLIRKTWPSFRDTVLPQVKKFIPPQLITSWNHTDKIIELINQSRIRYGGLGDEPDAWEKWMSGEYGFIAIDQAEDFTETEFRMLATRLRLKLPGIRYYFLLTCNPSQGWLKRRFIEQRLPDHVFIPSLPRDNIKNLPYDYIERMKNILEDENLIKTYLEGSWDAIADPDNIYPYSKIEEAFNRRVEPSEPIELGIDVARSGVDETVIALREGFKITLAHMARGHDLMRTAGETWRVIRDDILPRWQGRLSRIRVKVDADGLGAGLIDRLNEQREEKELEFSERGESFKIEIVEIHGSARAQQPTRFKNLRSEIHWALREVLDEISLPDDADLKAQLLSMKYRINSAGQIEIVSKEEIKARLGRSPDRAEAVIYALAPVDAWPDPKIWRI